MATRSQTTSITLSMSATQARDTLRALNAQADSLRKALQNAVDAGDAGKAKKLQSEINRTNSLIRRMQTETASVERVLSNLDKASPKELRQTLSALNRQIQNMTRGTEEFNRTAARIRSVREELARVNTAMQAQPTLWQRISKAGYGAVSVIQAGLATVMQLMQKAREYVDAYAGMQEEMAGVSKYSGMSAEEVGRLNEEFKKMDTRTSREDLNRLAQDAGRLGKTSVEDILGFVRAADQINVALDDLGDGATLTLSKITGLFGLEEKYGTETALLKTGSVINDLSQNCSAGAGYIAEFTTRMAASGAQAKLSIPDIMAYGAVMDEAGVNVEQSSTAISKLVIKLFQEPSKYAKAAGLDMKTWYTTLQKDANEGFLQFIEGLKNQGGIDKLAPLFKEMGESGIGAMNALGLLSNRLDKVREQQAAANESFEEGTSITTEFSVANSTVAAELDKNKNEFHETAVAIGEQLLPAYNLLTASGAVLMKTVSWLIELAMKNKAVIIAGALAYGIYTAAVNAAAIKTAVLTAVEKARAAIMAAGKIITLASAAAYNTMTGNVTRADAAMRLLNKQIAVSKVLTAGLAVVIAAAIVAVTKWALSFRAAAIEAEGLEKAQKSINDLRVKATQRMEDERRRLEALDAAARNEKLSLDERKNAINELNRVIPTYNGQLDATTGRYRANKQALDDYLDSLRKKYEIEGAADTLREIGNQRAKLKADKAAAEAKAEEAGERITSTGNIVKYAIGTALAPILPASVPYFFKDPMTAAVQPVVSKDYDRQLAVLDKQEEAINKIYGKDIERMEANKAGQTPAAPPDIPEPEPDAGAGPSAPPASSGGGTSTQDKAKRKRAEAKAKKEFKEGLDAIDAAQDRADALTMGEYKTGMIEYSEYLERLHESELKMIDDKIEYYRKAGLEEDEDVAELQKRREKEDMAYGEKKRKASLADIKREREMQETQAQIDYVTPGTDIFRDEEALQERLFRLKIYYMQREKALYQEGSEEYLSQTEAIAEAEQQEKLRKQEQTAELMMKYSLEYQLQDVNKREQLELAVLDELHKQGLLKEDEYQKALKEIREKYEKERKEKGDSGDGSGKKRNKASDVNIPSEWGDMVVALYNAVTLSIDESEDKLTQWSKKVAAIAQASFAMISAVTQQITAYSSAQVEYETALVEKSFDKRIKAAKNNSALQARLETQKERAIAKIKAKASKQQFAMQIANAVAQTATNAIAAYGAALQTGPLGLILAPIAAALAVAAGAIQIATIKKQAATAEIQGYSEGGFTRPGDKDEPAGVVHAGEWVASQKLVNNPRTRPLIDILEHAQRTNSWPSITAGDVSRTVTAQTVTAAAVGNPPAVAEPAPIVVNNRDPELRAAVARLSAILEGGISARVSMTGRDGVDDQTRRFNQIMNNRKMR